MAERPSTSKTRGICKYFQSRRGCHNGDMCKFIHGDGETLSAYDKNKACRFYAAGFCKHGDKCWFRHVNNTSAAVEDGSYTGQESGSETGEDGDLLCSICQEKPVTFGLLEDCSHVFCLECIRGWRVPSGKSPEIIESGNTKRCPYCRASSKFVTPSSIFYPNGDPQKALTITNYKDSMARVPCRYFEMSRPGARYCPFGRDCFYQHKESDGIPYVFDRGANHYMTIPRSQNRRRNATFPDLSSDVRASRSQDVMWQILADIRDRLEAHFTAEEYRLVNLVGAGVVNLLSGSSEEEHVEEEQSVPSMPSILATLEDSATASALPLTRAFMDNNMLSDAFALFPNVQETEREDILDNGPSTRIPQIQSFYRRRSLPNLTNTWTEDSLDVQDAGGDDFGITTSSSSTTENVERSLGEQLEHNDSEEVQAPHDSIASTSTFEPEETYMDPSHQPTAQQEIVDDPLVSAAEDNEDRSLLIPDISIACEDNNPQERELRNKPDSRPELTSRRVKSTSGTAPCSGRRHGGQSFVTDGRGRVVATDDWTITDGAGLACWSPATPLVAPSLAEMGEMSGQPSNEVRALDDLD